MGLVHLVRHATHAEVGRVLSGRSDIALSGTGRREAAALAELTSFLPLQAIYSSPRRRALETASFVADRCGLTLQIADALDEIDFGEWTGCSFDKLDGDERWHSWNERRGEGRAPAGETMVAAVARARSFLAAITEEEVLCVSHCDIIRGIAADYLELPLDRLLAMDCDPASLTTLSVWPGGGRLVALNERPRPCR